MLLFDLWIGYLPLFLIFHSLLPLSVSFVLTICARISLIGLSRMCFLLGCDLLGSLKDMSVWNNITLPIDCYTQLDIWVVVVLSLKEYRTRSGNGQVFFQSSCLLSEWKVIKEPNLKEVTGDIRVNSVM